MTKTILPQVIIHTGRKGTDLVPLQVTVCHLYTRINIHTRNMNNALPLQVIDHTGREGLDPVLVQMTVCHLYMRIKGHRKNMNNGIPPKVMGRTGRKYLDHVHRHMTVGHLNTGNIKGVNRTDTPPQHAPTRRGGIKADRVRMQTTVCRLYMRTIGHTNKKDNTLSLDHIQVVGHTGSLIHLLVTICRQADLVR